MGIDGEHRKLVSRIRHTARRWLATGLLTLGLAPGAGACGLELVLALDVSRSVLNAEYNLQRQGLADALTSPEVIDAIGWMRGGAMVTLTQWSGPATQAQTIGWRHLTDARSVRAFAAEVARNRRQFFSAYTAVGEALWHANTLSATNPLTCRRRVIDVSGDGASNRGRAPGPIASALAANGVTINALVITGAKPDPVDYYRENVVRGTGAFLEVAHGFDDYTRAMRRKLTRELGPAVAMTE